MNRVKIHSAPKTEIGAHLGALGLAHEPAAAQSKYDFLIEGHIRLALRVALPSPSKRRTRIGDKNYHYVYNAWNFNFHHRGKVGEQYTDFFACVPLRQNGEADKEVDLRKVFVLPWKVVRAKTFYLPDSRRPYAGRFSSYRNAWDQVVTAARDLERTSSDQISPAHTSSDLVE